ncbi:MAG: histidinol-phosphate transaminase [Bacteroidetes bacterium]|jgi:histidinol-phosphate aminotransferase|nr:MAG: histidinol phosphate aminotransferase [Cryomorphaceae bacterium BACL29 MAG-121220-bin8]MDA0758078.1 histidinol-phosphate transaminase [Bacteroidota bacterium]MDA1019206.1 histidinol-phosphate transaminase [Bacteroidota bacterium]|tara:strand:- start:39551 stop:40588 length:1038 start_codon:yes stop_codon:yes gene_type:complete
MDIDKLVRDNIKKMSSYSSARDEYKNGVEENLIYLDANESPFDNGINRYPDNKHNDLKTVVSKIKNIDKDQIVFGNGTDEILDLIIRVFCNPNNDKIITLPPTYGMYDVIAKTNSVENIEIPLKNDFSIDKNEILRLNSINTKVLFLCSPNNPTGNSFDYNDLNDLIKGFDGIVVVDEAYIDFSSKPSLINIINEYDNLIITQTMSKAYGMAGIRLGMGFSNKEIINYINKIKPPYNINILTENKALNELSKADQLNINISLILNLKKVLISCLKKLHFVEKIYKSDANFLLVKVDDADLRYGQLLEKGIIVRNRSNQYLCENCLRITIGTQYENKILIKTLNEL